MTTPHWVKSKVWSGFPVSAEGDFVWYKAAAPVDIRSSAAPCGQGPRFSEGGAEMG